MQPTLFIENAPKQILKPEIGYLCETYGLQRVGNDSAWYEKTRGGKPASIFSFWGYKCCEFAASQFLTERYGLPTVAPDMKIYKRGQKTWDADLVYNNINFGGKDYKELRFHVKSANEETISEGYPESFVFQMSNRSGNGGMDKILTDGNENDFVVLVYNPYTAIQQGGSEFHIRGMVPWTFAKNYLENPKAPSLIGKKICLYTKTLQAAIGL